MSLSSGALDLHWPPFTHNPNTLTLPHGPLLLLSFFLAFTLLGAIYRVYFSPLAGIPGPFLAGLTTWYNTYYDVWKPGQYFKKIQTMHARYGPIIRIAPFEVHVDDPSFIEVLLTGSSKRRDKSEFQGRSVTLPGAAFGTIPHDLHRRRRAALNPFFSKQSIRRLEPIIQAALQTVLDRMEQYKQQKAVFPASLAYQAITSDVITKYCFGTSTEHVKMSDWNEPYSRAFAENLQMCHYYIHFWPIGHLIKALPMTVKTRLFPGITTLFKLQKASTLIQWVRQIDAMRAAGPDKTDPNIVFHGLLFSSLPEPEKSTDRLTQEGEDLIIAGQDTTARSLASLTFEILHHPRVLRKLKAELAHAIPDPSQIPTCAQVETLPYLTAVIHEGLRLHPAAMFRQSRTSPDEPLLYEDHARGTTWRIPPHTPVSMDATSIHQNSHVFDHPADFRPERWLENPHLDRYLLTFSRGTRHCVGINLAWQELYLVIAGVFRRYDLFDAPTTLADQGPTLELFDTIKERDVDGVSDFMVPFGEKGSKGLRLLVH